MSDETRALREAERICHAADVILRQAEESYANLMPPAAATYLNR